MAAEVHLLLRVTVFVDVGVLFSGFCVVVFLLDVCVWCEAIPNGRDRQRPS